MAASDLSHRYLWGPAVDQLLADKDISSPTQPGAILWPLADHLGTIRDIAQYNSTTNQTTIANHRRYDAFGKLLSQTDGGPTISFGFTGLLFETLTSLQYNRARWYDPRIGQFVSKDPIEFAGGDTNLRRYVGNGPTHAMDRSGGSSFRIRRAVASGGRTRLGFQ